MKIRRLFFASLIAIGLITPTLADPVTLNVPVTLHNWDGTNELTGVELSFDEPAPPVEEPAPDRPKPVVVLTFDQWREAATEAFPIMLARNLPGTYYITPSWVNSTSGAPLATLVLMKELGWEIGAYTNANMVTMEVNDRVAALNHLKTLKSEMDALGFPVASIAPGQRAWSNKLANLVDGLFSCVRVVDIARVTAGHWLELPFNENPHYIQHGATNSLSIADTTASLSATVDQLITEGGAWVVVIHRVSDDGTNPNYTITRPNFAGFMDKLAAEVANDNIEVKTFKDLCAS